MSKGINQAYLSTINVAENNKKSVITASVFLYATVYLFAGLGGLSFNTQPALGYVQTSSNTACPQGSIWIETNNFHWCDGSTEYSAVDESGDRITLVDGTVAGPSGALWIEGSDFHWIDSDDDEYAYTGVDTGNNPSTATPGDLWLEGGYIHYIDASGNERTISE